MKLKAGYPFSLIRNGLFANYTRLYEEAIDKLVLLARRIGFTYIQKSKVLYCAVKIKGRTI